MLPVTQSANTRDNTLEAIRYGHPARVPLFDGTVWDAVQLGGNFRFASWTDAWGTVWEMTEGELAPVDVRHPLADLSKLDQYAWPDPVDLTWTDDDQRAFNAIDATRMLRGGIHIKFVFERLCCLMGMDNLLVAFYEEPDRLQVVIDRVVAYNRAAIRRLLDLGIDTLHVSEDLGAQNSLLLSPALIRHSLLPAYEQCFEEALARGAIIDFHSCGHVQEIAADLAAVGIGVLNPVQASANDQAAVKCALMGKTAILGGINSAIILTGTPDDVRAEVRRAFSVLKPGGGWIAAPDQVVPHAHPDNLAALWDTCRELAPY